MRQAFTLNLIPDTTDTINLAPIPRLLSPAELGALDVRIASNADNWLADNFPKKNVEAKTEQEPKSATGRNPRSIHNPFYGFIGCTTYWERYPAFAMDAIEGVARLDWHDRPVGVGGKSMPLSVRKLALILESLPDVTTESVMELLRLGARHARRYVKAIELIMPWIMVCRPQSLCREMEGIESDPRPCAWEDQDALLKPSAEELAQLHHDLRTLTQYKSAEEYEAEDAIGGAFTGDVLAKTSRQQHSKRHEVLSLLAKGTPIKAIERETRVQPKTIRKWRDEVFALAA